MTSMIKASVVGAAILLSAHVLWGWALASRGYSEQLVWALWLFPFIAAFAVAYLAPRKKLFLGMSMALFGALLSGVSNFVYHAFGMPVDFPGFRGGVTLFVIALLTNAVLCALGSSAGYFFSTRLAGGGNIKPG